MSLTKRKSASQYKVIWRCIKIFNDTNLCTYICLQHCKLYFYIHFYLFAYVRMDFVTAYATICQKPVVVFCHIYKHESFRGTRVLKILFNDGYIVPIVQMKSILNMY